MTFFIGVHDLPDAVLFENCMVSVNRLKATNGGSNWHRWLKWYWNSDRKKPFKPRRSAAKRAARKAPFPVKNWILDSGAFTCLATMGTQMSIAEYVTLIEHWHRHGNLLAAVTQDYMCVPFMLEKMKQTVEGHQSLTVYRYDAIKKLLDARGIDVYLMPVLQGYQPEEYVAHVRQYSDRLKPGMWLGVGSIRDRNDKPKELEAILLAIRRELKAQGLHDIRLHGFGLKDTALKNSLVDALVDTSDSMSWEYDAGRKKVTGDDRRALGIQYEKKMNGRSRQLVLTELFV